MENSLMTLKALANETRIKLLEVLLKRNYCVKALARRLKLTEAAVSQHIKVLREAGLLKGVKRGYFMHYEVDHERLRLLARAIEAFSCLEREAVYQEEWSMYMEKTCNDICHPVPGKSSSQRSRSICPANPSGNLEMDMKNSRNSVP